LETESTKVAQKVVCKANLSSSPITKTNSKFTLLEQPQCKAGTSPSL
jgi:hypothetical protein